MTPSTSDQNESTPPVETILLSVPASGPYSRLARMSGAALALRRGLSLAAVDDLRLAIDEALILLLDHRDREGSIDLRFALEPNGLTVEMQPNFADGPPTLSADEVDRFAALAGPLLSSFSLDVDTGILVLTKNSRAATE